MTARLAMVREYFSWKDPVINKNLTTPPVSNRGDRHIVGVGASDAWATHDNKIAVYDGSVYFYLIPDVGWVVRDDSTGIYWEFTGSAWVQPEFFKNDKVKGDATDPTAGYLDAKVDGSTVVVNASHQLEVPDDAITADKINADVAGVGIVPNGATGALDINVDGTTIQIVADVVGVKPDGIGPTEIDETADYTMTGTIDATGGDITVANSPNSGASAINKDYVMGLIDGLDWQESVKDRFDPTTALPVGPSEGDRYLAIASGNGWTDKYIYEYRDSSWVEIIPDEGFAILVEDEDAEYVYNGTLWVLRGGTTQHNNTSGLQGGTANEYYHLTNAHHTGLTGGGDAGALHNHNGVYTLTTALNSTTNGSSGGSIIGIPTLTNLGSATEVESALEYVDSNWSTLTQDKLSAVSSNDSTPGYLNGKLAGVANKIVLTETVDGGDEVLTITIGSHVFDKNLNTLDHINDGTNYGRVLVADIYNGHVTRLEDATASVTVVQAKDAHTRRGIWDADYESIVFDV